MWINKINKLFDEHFQKEVDEGNLPLSEISVFRSVAVPFAKKITEQSLNEEAIEFCNSQLNILNDMEANFPERYWKIKIETYKEMIAFLEKK
jgi:hypothetical protein